MTTARNANPGKATRHEPKRRTSTSRVERIVVRGMPRNDIDLHLLAQALTMISEDLNTHPENPSQPGTMRESVVEKKAA